MNVHIVMVDSGDTEGGLSGHTQPWMVFEDHGSAECYAARIKQRPDGVDFWIPPAAVHIVTMELHACALPPHELSRRYDNEEQWTCPDCTQVWETGVVIGATFWWRVPAPS